MSSMLSDRVQLKRKKSTIPPTATKRRKSKAVTALPFKMVNVRKKKKTSETLNMFTVGKMTKLCETAFVNCKLDDERLTKCRALLYVLVEYVARYSYIVLSAIRQSGGTIFDTIFPPLLYNMKHAMELQTLVKVYIPPNDQSTSNAKKAMAEFHSKCLRMRTYNSTIDFTVEYKNDDEKLIKLDMGVDFTAKTCSVLNILHNPLVLPTYVPKVYHTIIRPTTTLGPKLDVSIESVLYAFRHQAISDSPGHGNRKRENHIQFMHSSIYDLIRSCPMLTYVHMMNPSDFMWMDEHVTTNVIHTHITTKHRFDYFHAFKTTPNMQLDRSHINNTNPKFWMYLNSSDCSYRFSITPNNNIFYVTFRKGVNFSKIGESIMTINTLLQWYLLQQNSDHVVGNMLARLTMVKFYGELKKPLVTLRECISLCSDDRDSNLQDRRFHVLFKYLNTLVEQCRKRLFTTKKECYLHSHKGAVYTTSFDDVKDAYSYEWKITTRNGCFFQLNLQKLVRINPIERSFKRYDLLHNDLTDIANPVVNTHKLRMNEKFIRVISRSNVFRSGFCNFSSCNQFSASELGQIVMSVDNYIELDEVKASIVSIT